MIQRAIFSPSTKITAAVTSSWNDSPKIISIDKTAVFSQQSCIFYRNIQKTVDKVAHYSTLSQKVHYLKGERRYLVKLYFLQVVNQFFLSPKHQWEAETLGTELEFLASESKAFICSLLVLKDWKRKIKIASSITYLAKQYLLETQCNPCLIAITVDIFNNLSFFYSSRINFLKASTQFWMKLVTVGIYITSEM